MDRQSIYPVLMVIAGAILFGASAPLAKVLLGSVDPLVLAALLYLGSGIGLALFWLGRKVMTAYSEAGIERRDVPWLAGAVLAGGVIAPVLLMISLKDTPAATASLLLNFECVATTIIAAVIFREAVGRRVWMAVALIAAASALLSFNTGSDFGVSIAALGVIGACIFWGIDNNLTCNISAKDPVAIGMIKGLVAGGFSLAVALLLQRPLPDLASAAAVMLLGTVSYGLSIVLFIMAIRGLGAARTGAWFGLAPFAGAGLSLVLFPEVPALQFFVSLIIMALGAFLLFGEEHDHLHVHTAFEHEHYYIEDTHHPFKVSAGTHLHGEVRHSHPHRPDIHHRHEHENEPAREDEK